MNLVKRELVTPDKERPKPPAKCLAVRRRDLLQNYARPQVGGTLAQLFVQEIIQFSVYLYFVYYF